MKVVLSVLNRSGFKVLCQRHTLERLAGRICAGEGRRGSAELSLLLTGDDEIARFNAQYRAMPKATDVLSFSPPAGPAGAGLLGDLVISMETVARRCGNSRARMRDEFLLLYCHGLLHLLGYDHATSPERRIMQEKQAHYLDIAVDAAWRTDGFSPGERRRVSRGGGKYVVGRQ
jgi:probable rRNA maturation factor